MDRTAFWMRAAHMSGRLDLSSFVRDHRDPSDHCADAPALVRAGLRLDQAARLCAGPVPRTVRPHLRVVAPPYPARLARQPHAPPVLFHEGALSLLERPAVAVVGTRRCTPEGRQHARALGRAVAAAGGVVVSGGAWGIDAEAHRAAEGATIAVLGQGIAAPMTRRLRALCDHILEAGGLLLSEFPPETPAQAWTFPLRNRVVAGLSAGVVVVEAAQRSGALITARDAAELGREVWAVPGDPRDPARAGCLRLIRDGARVYLSPGELLDELGLDGGAAPAPADATGLVAQLADAPTIEALVARTGKPLPALLRALAGLQLAGIVERTADDRYRAATGG